jgi:putative addiction module killer protein
MKRRIIAYGSHYRDFFDALDKSTQEKILYGMLQLQTRERLPSKFMKYIRDGLYELRIEWQGNIYRIFFCFDEDYIVILFNGFQKKKQKTPEREIKKALKLKAEYEKNKKNRNI